ncbi:cilia- and flagella-associated protein 69-like [Boleophthalmus pectinirostris]|uniref:cilia- and flagella-associated protein 69-like n=1 Tax=Boleophthalmus pectinirostris TaxID=150288 RepID=UPI00242C81E9|nr:cilia- and flagella-associated protein 69-like [Boleophthalmus pectinirostris]
MDSRKLLQRRKPEIPTFKSATTDRKQLEDSAKNIELSKVIRLLEDPLTGNLKERHLFVLKKILKRNPNGFLLKDLKGLAKVFDICAEKSKEDPVYLPFLCEAIKLCRLSFLKERASDEPNYAQDVIHFLSQIGYLMRVTCPDVKVNIIECVKSFYQCVTPRQLPDGTQRRHGSTARPFHFENRFSKLTLRPQPMSPGFRLQLLDKTDLSQTLVLSLASVDHRPDIKLQLLQVLKLLSCSSDLNCGQILKARGAESICLHMNESESTGPVLVRSIEILWNLLESGNKHRAVAQLSTIECLVSLKEAFLHQLLTAVHHSELSLRNDLLVLTTLIAENSNTLLIESLFAKLLISLSTYPELRPTNPLFINLKLNYCHEDLKMKKMLLNLLSLMSVDTTVLQLYKEENVLLSLLLLTKPLPVSPRIHSASRSWSSVQSHELCLKALETLCSIAPYLLDEYMSYHGNAFVLRLMDWCTHDDEVPDTIRGSTGLIGDCRKTLLHFCIRLLTAVTSQGEETVNQDLCDQGSIGDLLGVLMQMEASSDEDDAVSLEIKSNIQFILSTLCESDMHRKELFGSEGVEMVIHFLKKGCDLFYSGLGHNKLLLSTVDCVWSCIVGCYTTEDFFLAKEGVCLLLDLLCSSPKCVHSLILSTLLELCENPNTGSHLRSWTDRAGQTAPRVLLQMWRDEEAELGVQRNQEGCITDPKKPLYHKQQEETQSLCLDGSSSASILEIGENLRAKIYLIFCAVGFHDLPGLSTEDYVTLRIVKRYLDFKVGEVWDEVSAELTHVDIRPITPDRENLETICQISEDKAKRVMEEQSSLLQRQEKENLTQEQLMYTEIKSHRKQQELVQKSWNDYVSKTSNYEVLKEVKAQRELSRAKVKTEEDGIHPVKHFIGQVVSMETTGAEGPEGVQVSLAQVAIKPKGPDPVQTSPNPDPEYFRPVSVKH